MALLCPSWAVLYHFSHQLWCHKSYNFGYLEHIGIFLMATLNCQVKCNSVLKNTSKGDFQPRHLRGRRLSLAMKDATTAF